MPGRVHVGDASRTCPDTTRIEIPDPGLKVWPQAAFLENMRWLAPPYKGSVVLRTGEALIKRSDRPQG